MNEKELTVSDVRQKLQKGSHHLIPKLLSKLKPKEEEKDIFDLPPSPPSPPPPLASAGSSEARVGETGTEVLSDSVSSAERVQEALKVLSASNQGDNVSSQTTGWEESKL